MIKIELNASELEKLKGLKQKLQQAADAGLDHGARLWKDEMHKQIGRTYKRPSKYTYKDSAGHTITREWRRTGDLRRGHDVVAKVGERQLVLQGNAGKPIKNYPGGYAEKLAKLPISPDGVDRSNDYKEDAKSIVEDLANRAMLNEARNRLRELSR